MKLDTEINLVLFLLGKKNKSESEKLRWGVELKKALGMEESHFNED